MDDKQVSWERIVAEREIQRALYTYCRGIDRRDAELLRSVYHDDAIDDHGGAFCGSADGYTRWVIDHLLKFENTMHTLHNMLIDVDGDSARAETYCIAHHVRKGEGAAGENGELIMDVFGCRYIDRFEYRTGPGWRIAHRVVTREWRMNQPMLPEADQPQGFAASTRDRSDLTYAEQLPLRAGGGS